MARVGDAPPPPPPDSRANVLPFRPAGKVGEAGFEDALTDALAGSSRTGAPIDPRVARRVADDGAPANVKGAEGLFGPPPVDGRYTAEVGRARELAMQVLLAAAALGKD